MGKVNDLTDKRFGRLVVIGDSGERLGRNIKWLCKCDCGNETTVGGTNLTKGTTVSCGCLRIEKFETYIEKDTFEKGTRITTLKEGRKIRKDNTSGVRGVCWNKQVNAWTVQMMFKGERVLYKNFKSKQDAINARKEAEEKYFKPILEKYNREVADGE